MNRGLTFNKMKAIFLILSLILFVACSSNSPDRKDNLVLCADREAPLGWLHLKLYNDKKFDFISKGLREETIYPGVYRFHADTIFLSFKDTVPKAADDTLVIGENGLSYQNKQGGLSITLNKLAEN